MKKGKSIEKIAESLYRANHPKKLLENTQIKKTDDIETLASKLPWEDFAEYIDKKYINLIDKEGYIKAERLSELELSDKDINYLTYDNQEKTISSEELHSFLGIKNIESSVKELLDMGAEKVKAKKPKEEFKDLLKITKRKQQPSIITPSAKKLSPKEMQLLLPSAKGYYAGEGFTIKPGRTRTARQIISSLKKKIASPEKIKYENKLLALREKFVEQSGKEKTKRISIENRKKMLTDYIIEGIPDPEVRKTFVHAVEKVKTDNQLLKLNNW